MGINSYPVSIKFNSRGTGIGRANEESIGKANSPDFFFCNDVYSVIDCALYFETQGTFNWPSKIFFISISILLLIGWWQLIITAYTGSNPLPMGIINSWLGGLGHGVRDAIDLGYGRKYMFRMSSFEGEPR